MSRKVDPNLRAWAKIENDYEPSQRKQKQLKEAEERAEDAPRVRFQQVEALKELRDIAERAGDREEAAAIQKEIERILESR